MDTKKENSWIETWMETPRPYDQHQLVTGYLVGLFFYWIEQEF